jgi:hypothetical protein
MRIRWSQCPQVARHFSNLVFAFQQWNRGQSWTKKLSKALIWMSSLSESHWWYRIYVTKKWRAATLQPGLEFDDFKPRLESGIFKCISWLNGSYFGRANQGFLKEGVKAYLKAQMSPLDSPTLSLPSVLHIYSLWVRRWRSLIRGGTWQRGKIRRRFVRAVLTVTPYFSAKPCRVSPGQTECLIIWSWSWWLLPVLLLALWSKVWKRRRAAAPIRSGESGAGGKAE